MSLLYPPSLDPYFFNVYPLEKYSCPSGSILRDGTASRPYSNIVTMTSHFIPSAGFATGLPNKLYDTVLFITRY